ncbi:hypothetical protein [Solibacillus sp. NPDC093137]|uniref:hypothetical protein n=1 Tax=Solibacillus sp. NPDC093137 TaxID=3390678 RepID=UPI003D02B6CD
MNIVETVNTALENVPEPGSKLQYRILNDTGLIFTRHSGFVELNNKTYGHLFNVNEIDIALNIINEHKEQAYKEVDKIGSAFIKAANSPFGNAGKMVMLLIGTFLFLFVTYVILKFEFATQLSNLLNNSAK